MQPAKDEELYGGTATIAFDNVVFKITKQDSDIRGIGRWSYLTLTGNNMLNTTILSCYYPVIGSSPGSVYSQHLVYMSKNRTSIPAGMTCPRQLLGHDLKSEIDKLIVDGHQVIIAENFNADYFGLTKWMLDKGLQNPYFKNNMAKDLVLIPDHQMYLYTVYLEAHPYP